MYECLGCKARFQESKVVCPECHDGAVIVNSQIMNDVTRLAMFVEEMFEDFIGMDAETLKSDLDKVIEKATKLREVL